MIILFIQFNQTEGHMFICIIQIAAGGTTTTCLGQIQQKQFISTVHFVDSRDKSDVCFLNCGAAAETRQGRASTEREEQHHLHQHRHPSMETC